MTHIKTAFASLAMISLTACAIPAVNDAIMPGPTEPVIASQTTPNPYGITGQLNTRDAEALFTSLEGMISGLSQNEQLVFLEALFRVAVTDNCDNTGQWLTAGNAPRRGSMSFGNCARTAKTATFFDDYARAYVANKRMDNNYAYVASNAFGAWTGGTSQRESFVNFITLYGDVINGRDADYILWRNSAIQHRTAQSQRGQY